MRSSLLLAALIASGTRASAQRLSKQCFTDICYQLHIPEGTARSGNGDIYFQISGPTSYSWIALGQGTGMTNSNIFVMYTDGTGNVTLSPRHGVGHVEPEHDTTASVTLLAGSGVSRGRMVANVLCSNCESWKGGSTNFTSDSGSWMHASLPGDPLDSTDVNEDISQHQDRGLFTWDYTSAQGGNDINPFVTRAGSGGVSQSPQSTPNSGSTAESSTPEAGSSVPTNINMIIQAHGCLGAIAFLVLFPSGAIFIRLLTSHVWIHAAIQIFSYCCLVAAAGLGIYVARTFDLTSNHHPIIGLILFAVLFFQPILGLLHHSLFKKKHKRTVLTHVHIWVGRPAIILGMINGGLGIQLAGNVKREYQIAYGVVAGVMGVVYLATIVYGELKRRKGSSLTDEGERKGRGDKPDSRGRM